MTDTEAVETPVFSSSPKGRRFSRLHEDGRQSVIVWVEKRHYMVRFNPQDFIDAVKVFDDKAV
jgi:hypothetical protein